MPGSFGEVTMNNYVLQDSMIFEMLGQVVPH